MPARAARLGLERRLREVSRPIAQKSSVLRLQEKGPLPAFERLVSKTGAGLRLEKLIQQSGSRVSPSAVIVTSLITALVLAFLVSAFMKVLPARIVAGVIGLAIPFVWLMRKRKRRFKKFEEQFPEALDLLSRAIRAGHAFQTALGMVADELPQPVGGEFKETFDQQNFGLPLKEALNELAERIPIMDVKFFATAVTIQRETGGNLSEILDNLAHVVRERFKILRQVRVHTAHGRFTGYVLVALPAALAMALYMINPGHMNLLFREHMGQMMLTAAMVMQTIGFIWIRQVIKIEV
jgi:tight adherence protein B